MWSSSQQSDARPLVAISQAEELRRDAHSENEPARDEYPIRHAWTFVIPPAPADRFAAHKER
jgi:hypothetical protein